MIALSLFPLPDASAAHRGPVAPAPQPTVEEPRAPHAPDPLVRRQIEIDRRQLTDGLAATFARLFDYQPRRYVASVTPVYVNGETVWDDLAQCEAGGNWAENQGTIFDGGLQFHPGTWDRYRDPEHPPEAWQASREDQIEVGERVQASEGWGAWPSCSRSLGLR